MGKAHLSQLQHSPYTHYFTLLNLGDNFFLLFVLVLFMIFFSSFFTLKIYQLQNPFNSFDFSHCLFSYNSNYLIRNLIFYDFLFANEKRN